MTEQEELIIKEAEMRIFSLTSDCIVLKKENDKLRELVQELWGRDVGLYCSIDGTCRDPLCKRNGECSLDNRMRELGIEVGDSGDGQGE